MRLDDGWNQIQFNLSDFTRRAYGTNYVETLRVQIHANCRIRRIYFSDRLYSEDELPSEFKLFLPIQVQLLARMRLHAASHPRLPPSLSRRAEASGSSSRSSRGGGGGNGRTANSADCGWDGACVPRMRGRRGRGVLRLRSARRTLQPVS